MYFCNMTGKKTKKSFADIKMHVDKLDIQVQKKTQKHEC